MSDTTDGEYTVTVNYGFKKPVPNQDYDIWGYHINGDLDALDNLIKTQIDGIFNHVFMPLAGGKMDGPLQLAHDPILSDEAATKQSSETAAVTLGIPRTMMAQPNGVATLDSKGLLSPAQWPPSATGTIRLRGTWNPTTNTPTLGNNGAGGVANDYYVAAVSGTSVPIDGNTTWVAGDWLLHNGFVWQRIVTTTGLGTMAYQSDSAVNITGGSVTATAGKLSGMASVGLNSGDTLLPEYRIAGVTLAFTDAPGNINSYITTDGAWFIANANISNLATTNFQPVVLTFGQSNMLQADRRNRYAEAWIDSTDNASLALTHTGSLAFTPASGVLAKHLQSRIERSHVLSQGPPSHGNSVNTAGTSSTTYHLTATLDSGGFDAVRLIIPSMRTPAGATITACVAVSANPTDRINPKDGAGNPVEWRPVTFGSAGAAVDWEDQPYGTVSLTTSAPTVIGGSVLTFASTVGVSVGMVVFIQPISSTTGMHLPNAWAQVTAVTSTTVTINKAIQNLDLAANWRVWFAPSSLTLAAWGGAGTTSANLQVSDWVSISSLDRSDGGRWPLVMVRVYATGGAHTSLVTDLSQTNWQNLADDRIWSCYTQAGDFVSSPASGFTSTTDNGTMIVGWLQFYSRSRGATIMWNGDSITQGVGGLMIGMGGTQLAAQALSSPACPLTAVGMVNGWNNHGIGSVIYDSALVHMDTFKPQVLLIAPWTRNGEFSKPPAGFPAYSQESADWYYQQTQRIVAKAQRRYRAQVMYFPTGPSDNAELTAATELVRMSAVKRARIANASGEMLLDQDVLLGSGSTPVNTSPYVGLHPPGPAQQIIALDLQRQYKTALGIV